MNPDFTQFQTVDGANVIVATRDIFYILQKKDGNYCIEIVRDKTTNVFEITQETYLNFKRAFNPFITDVNNVASYR